MKYDDLSRETLIELLREKDEEVRALKRIVSLALAEPTTPLKEIREATEQLAKIAPIAAPDAETLIRVEQTVDHMLSFLEGLGMRLSEMDQQIGEEPEDEDGPAD